MYIYLLVYSVGQSTQFSYAVVDALSTADRWYVKPPDQRWLLTSTGHFYLMILVLGTGGLLKLPETGYQLYVRPGDVVFFSRQPAATQARG
jgi:hypothetical protein